METAARKLDASLNVGDPVAKSSGGSPPRPDMFVIKSKDFALTFSGKLILRMVLTIDDDKPVVMFHLYDENNDNFIKLNKEEYGDVLIHVHLIDLGMEEDDWNMLKDDPDIFRSATLAFGLKMVPLENGEHRRDLRFSMKRDLINMTNKAFRDLLNQTDEIKKEYENLFSRLNEIARGLLASTTVLCYLTKSGRSHLEKFAKTTDTVPVASDYKPTSPEEKLGGKIIWRLNWKRPKKKIPRSRDGHQCSGSI